MKKIFLLLFIFWSTVSLYAQLLKQSSYIDSSKKNALIKTAKNVAMTFGPAYVPFFKDVEVSGGQVFQKEDYDDSFPEIRKQIGRKYYTVIFTYDSTSVRFAFDYAAKVRIWKDTSTPLDVIFGNGMGRNFLFQSFKKQTKRFSKKGKKRVALLIEQVPLQTENENRKYLGDKGQMKQDSRCNLIL